MDSHIISDTKKRNILLFHMSLKLYMHMYTNNSFQMDDFNSLFYKTLNYFSFIALCIYK